MKYISPEEGRAKRGNLKYLEELTRLARQNRKKMTQGEIIIWGLLKEKRTGHKFLKQKPIGRFIIDFYCSKLLLAIEIDGGYHQKRINYDQGRDELLVTRGIKTIRFTEYEVQNCITEVGKKIKEEICLRIEEIK